MKPKPNRPRRKTGAARLLQIEEEKDAWAVIFDGLFWCASKLRGKHWELEEDECDELSGKVAEAVGRNVKEEWLKAYHERLKSGSPIVGAVAVAGTILWERFEQDRVIAAQKKAARRGRGDGGRPNDYPSRPDPEIPHEEIDDEADTDGVE